MKLPRVRFWLIVLGGLAGAALALSVTASEPFPVRNLRSELLCLLVAYPIALGAVCWHTRRRDRSLLVPAVGWFVLAFLVRAAFLGPVTSHNYHVRPEYMGCVGDDSYYQTALTRFYVYYLTGNPNHLQHEAMFLRPGSTSSAMAGFIDEAQLRSGLAVRPSFVMPVVPLVLLAGYSTVTVELPMALLAAFTVVLWWVYLRRVSTPRIATVTALWLTFSTSHVLHSLALHKEFPTALVLFYLIEREQQPFRWRALQDWIAVPLLLLWAMSIRLYLPPMIIFFLVFFSVRKRLRSERLRNFADLAVMLATLAYSWHQGNSSRGRNAPLLAPYPLGLPINLFAVPALSWAFTPGLGIDTQRPFDMPIALIWPLVAGLLLIGLLLYRPGRFKGLHVALLVSAIYYLTVSAVNNADMVAVRRRVCIEGPLMAFAAEVPAVVRAQPPAVQRRLAQLAAAFVLLLYAANLALVVLKGE